jgi:hypothetical protein
MIKLIKYSEMGLSELFNIALEKSEKEDPTLFGLIQEQRRKSNETFSRLVAEENDENKAIEKFNTMYLLGSKVYTKSYLHNMKVLKNYQDVCLLLDAYTLDLINDKLDWTKQLLINYIKQ